MERMSELKNNYGIRLVPVQWKTMLESGIEVDIINNRMQKLEECAESQDPRFNYLYQVL